MTEPTKFLPSEEDLQRWAAEHAKGSGFLLDVLSAEILRLRAELAKASAEVQRMESERGLFGPTNDGWNYRIISMGWRNGPESPSWIAVERNHHAFGKTEMLEFALKPGVIRDENGKPIVCDAPPPKFTPEQIAECMTDAPPADVLGESLRGRLCAALLDERVPASIYGAVHELAQVVERIARAQRGGK